MVKVQKCKPVVRDVCQIITQQQCVTVAEEVPFEVKSGWIEKMEVKYQNIK